MFSRKNIFRATLYVAALTAAHAASAQIASRRTTLIGLTFQGSEEPALLDGWSHTEGVAPRSRSKTTTSYGVDHYEKGPQHLFLLLQRMSGAKAKQTTWKVLDTLYVAKVERGKFLEFCSTCKKAGKPVSDVFITLDNKVTKTDTQNGYYSVAQIWQADLTTGKFIMPSDLDIKSYLPDKKR